MTLALIKKARDGKVSSKDINVDVKKGMVQVSRDKLDRLGDAMDEIKKREVA